MSTQQPQASSSSSRQVSVQQPIPTASVPRQAESGMEAMTPSTPLRPVKSSNGFEFPAIWSFPPFFTLQPNPSTLAHQLNLWTQLVLSWARHSRVFVVNCEAVDGGGEVFSNREINRRLLPIGMKQLLSHMSTEGHAAPDPPKQGTTFLLYWRKPEEWGTLIYNWVSENGLTGSIMTFYEITDGDLSYTTEFRELPLPLLRRALDTLVKIGKAQLLRGEGEMGDGVRFL